MYSMECRDFELQSDDYLDGSLDPVRKRSMQEHLEHCLSCRQRHHRAAALQASLRTLPAPELRRDFVNQALSRATHTTARAAWSPRRAALGAALAASLVLGVAVGVFFAIQPVPAPVQTVTLTVAQPETVRLMFNSPKSLSAATFSLTLPENVELEGYGNRRELSWQTDLREGGNLLQLPLIAHGPTKGEFVARVSHGTSSKTFQLKIEVKYAGRTGMSPVVPAT
jgi:hypothetical protein